MSNKDNLLVILTKQPWWVSAIVSLLVYLTLKYLVPLISFENFILQGFLKVIATVPSALAMLFLFPGMISFVNALERLVLFKRFHNMDRVFKLSTEDFPKWLFAYFKKQGFSVSNDLFPDNPLHDLRLKKDEKRTLVYGRYWKRELVEEEDIRLAYQDMSESYGDDCIVITSGQFTSEAREYAKARPIQLIDRPRFLVQFLGQPLPLSDGTSTFQLAESITPSDDRLRANQKAKRDSQALARQLWASEDFGHLNISKMAEVLRKREPAKHYTFDTVLKWAREAAPDEKRNKRGAPRK